MNLDLLATCLRDRLPGLLAIYLFGSHAADKAGPESDLDLAILLADKIDPVGLWTLADELVDMAGCPVDLVDLRTATTVLQYQIMMTGRRLWTRDHRAPLYESFILSEKTALDEARAPLLEIIRQEGSIHGR
ncbi:MAG: nucleotidyltransferase domain-containing protein [Magnetococcus sp. DMHC-1]|nr:nucleotidyltransferase domain-containing protein [Magnetococcales bacterium]